MATETVRPYDNITVNWNNYGYEKIDDVVTQPTVPPDGDFIACSKNDDLEEDQYSFTAPATAGTMTDVTLWVYGYVLDLAGGPAVTDRTLRVRLNGSWTSYKGWTGATTYEGANWSSYSWTVSGAAVGSSPAVGFKCPDGVEFGDYWYIYAAYLVITTGAPAANPKGKYLLQRFVNIP